MTIIWITTILVQGLMSGIGQVPLLWWLLLTPFIMNDYAMISRANARKKWQKELTCNLDRLQKSLECSWKDNETFQRDVLSKVADISAIVERRTGA